MRILKHPTSSAVFLPMAWSWRWFVLPAMVGVSLAASTVEEPSANPAAGIGEIILRMGDESYKVREKATRDLWNQGEAALPALREAVRHNNPEIAYRARELVRKVELFLTPDTDEVVISLVERYVQSSPERKEGLMRLLKERKAWRQMLKLYAGESDAGLRMRLHGLVDGVAMAAARERIAAGDLEEAREFLEMGPADAVGLLSLAEFHRTQGSWEKEWQKSGKLTGGRRHNWQLALLRAKGDVAAARAAAEAAGEDDHALVLTALDGDPVPWLAARAKEISRKSDYGKLYADLAIRYWRGEQVRESSLAPAVKALRSRNRSTRVAAMVVLAALGEAPMAEEAFARHDRIDAAEHFEALERMPDVLRALGLDPDEPDYAAWFGRRLRELSDDDVEDQRQPRDPGGEFVALAGLLERRGLHEELWNVLSVPLANLAEDEPRLFEELVASLFTPGATAGAPMLAERAGARWAGDNAIRWETLAIAALGDEELATTWWEWLEELDPDASALDRFRGLRALFRIGTDPDGLRDTWLERAWKAVDEAPAGKRSRLLGRLATFASYRIGSQIYLCADAGLFLRAYDRMDDEARKRIGWDELVRFLTADGRWDEAAEVVLKVIRAIDEAKGPVPPDLHALAAAVLRRTGRADEAEEHDRLAEQLALGDPGVAYLIGFRYAFCLDSERAARWWRKCALWCEPRSGFLVHALRMHGDHLLESGDWRRAASVGELSTVLVRLNNEYGTPFTELARARLQADMARALDRLGADREGSVRLLEKCHRRFRADGSLADSFFPALRKAGLRAEHDRWAEDTWVTMQSVIATYPACDNSRNTAAWLASRSLCHLDEAREILGEALKMRPRQAAYLDTMAEIHFAMKRRDEAIRWSDLALAYAPGDDLLRRQHERFLHEPLSD